MSGTHTGDRRPRAVTRLDVARFAGVSTAVVSYVVNDGPRPVAPATAAKVREAIDILGYRPNITARSLKLGSTGMLGLIVPDSSNPFFAEFALEIERAAAARGLALLMANSGSDLERETRLMVELADRQVDGLIVAGAAGPPLVRSPGERRVTTSTVYVDAAVPSRHHHTVGSNVVEGSRLAVDHLLAVHHQPTVALLIGTGVGASTDGREIGWATALQQADRPEGSVVRAPFSREGGYEGGLRLLRRSPRPAAIFASSDLQAVGLLRAAYELGIRVPDDLAIVAFDGTTESEFCLPPLTSVRQRVREMAEAAIEVVLEQPAEPTHRGFDLDLLVRRSCGCP